MILIPSKIDELSYSGKHSGQSSGRNPDRNSANKEQGIERFI